MKIVVLLVAVCLSLCVLVGAQGASPVWPMSIPEMNRATMWKYTLGVKKETVSAVGVIGTSQVTILDWSATNAIIGKGVLVKENNSVFIYSLRHVVQPMETFGEQGLYVYSPMTGLFYRLLGKWQYSNAGKESIAKYKLEEIRGLDKYAVNLATKSLQPGDELNYFADIRGPVRTLFTTAQQDGYIVASGGRGIIGLCVLDSGSGVFNPQKQLIGLGAAVYSFNLSNGVTRCGDVVKISPVSDRVLEKLEKL